MQLPQALKCSEVNRNPQSVQSGNAEPGLRQQTSVHISAPPLLVCMIFGKSIIVLDFISYMQYEIREVSFVSIIGLLLRINETLRRLHKFSADAKFASLFTGSMYIVVNRKQEIDFILLSTTDFQKASQIFMAWTPSEESQYV